MKHRVKHNQLGRNTNQSKALYRGLISAVLEKGRIETSLAKAKAVRGEIDKVINLGKRNDINSRRLIVELLGKDSLLDKIYTQVSPRMSDRQSGYSRIIKTGPRLSDNTEMAFLELVEGVELPPAPVKVVEKPKEIVKTQTKIVIKKTVKTKTILKKNPQKPVRK